MTKLRLNGKRLVVESLESRLCLTTFLGSTPLAEFGPNATHEVAPADVDADGDLDLLAVSSSGPYWMENLDGNGDFGDAQFIDPSGGSYQMTVSDFDGDGDSDLVASWQSSLVLYANDGTGSFSRQAIIPSSLGISDLTHGDIDSDGDDDLIYTTRFGGASVRKNNGDGTFAAGNRISDEEVESLQVADLDGDGNLDIVGFNDSFDDEIMLFRNLDGTGSDFSLTIVASQISLFRKLDSLDIDQDGDLDILYATALRFAWLENTGNGNYSSAQDVAGIPGATSFVAADLNQDGMRDLILTGSSDFDVGWLMNLGGGTFGPTQPLDMQPLDQQGGGATVADLDGDGDVDIITSLVTDDRVSVYRNLDGMGAFGPREELVTPFAGASSMNGADFDGDGDNDLLVSTYHDDQVRWFENLDGQGTFGAQKLISDDSWKAIESIPADLDGDGDTDVLVAAAGNRSLTWFENDGLGEFNSETVISSSVFFRITDFAVADRDMDGDLDVFASWGSRVGWFENDGMGGFGLVQVLAVDSSAVTSFKLGDVNADGGLDLVYRSSAADLVVLDQPSFGVPATLIDSASGEFLLADMNGDGAAELIEEVGDDLFVSSIDAGGGFTLIDMVDMRYASWFTFGDIDLDGDIDLMAEDNWVPNSDGQGTLLAGLEMSWEASTASQGVLVDLTGDGYLDVVTARRNFDEKIVWQENRGSTDTLGPDLNGDGVVDVDDIDLLTTNVVLGPPDPIQFDLNDDGAVDSLDVDFWLVTAGALNNPSQSAYLRGDANLDGFVDVSDFNTWNANKFISDPRWSRGDFNSDGSVDVSDFGIWNGHKFNFSAAPFLVSSVATHGTALNQFSVREFRGRNDRDLEENSKRNVQAAFFDGQDTCTSWWIR